MNVNLDILRRGIFLVSLSLFFINFALPVQAKGLGANAVEIGALFSLFTLCLLVLRPLIGYGLDRFGRRPFFLVAMLAYVVANALYALAGDLPAMYGARLMQGIGAAVLLITVDTITADLTTPATRLTEMGRNVEVSTRASIAGAFVGFFLVGAVPLMAWTASFGVFAMAALAGLVFAAMKLPESHSQASRLAARGLEFRISPALRRLMPVIFVAGFANALVMPIYLIWLQDRFTIPPDRLAIAFLPAGIVFAVLPSKLARVVGRWGNVRALALGLCVAGGLYFLLPHLRGFPVIVLVFTLASVGWALVEPARKALVAEWGAEGAT
ncbi:MAG: MFS transporter, partial [Pseudomonadales bacterium]|nr:MFS transporter [Pseudomonadales bacterium]